jgi:hypothetical protein
MALQVVAPEKQP